MNIPIEQHDALFWTAYKVLLIAYAVFVVAACLSCHSKCHDKKSDDQGSA